MGNSDTRNKVEGKCMECGVLYTHFSEIVCVVTLNKKEYHVHQHGENITVFEPFKSQRICQYRAEMEDGWYPKPILRTNCERRCVNGLWEDVFDNDIIKVMSLKTLVGENAMKFAVFFERCILLSIPVEVRAIIACFSS